MGFIIRMRPIFMIFPLPEAEGLQSCIRISIFNRNGADTRIGRRKIWTKQWTDVILTENTFLKITCR